MQQGADGMGGPIGGGGGGTMPPIGDDFGSDMEDVGGPEDDGSDLSGEEGNVDLGETSGEQLQERTWFVKGNKNININVFEEYKKQVLVNSSPYIERPKIISKGILINEELMSKLNELEKINNCNPATSQAALYANYGGLDVLGFAGGYGQAGGGSYGPIGGFYIAQSMDIAFMATDLQYKSRLLRGDLTFKVTAGPEGTHIIHLYSTPGSKLTFGANFTPNGGLSLVGCEVWYTYYDTTGYMETQ